MEIRGEGFGGAAEANAKVAPDGHVASRASAARACPAQPADCIAPEPGREQTPACVPGHSHPPTKKRRGDRIHWMFAAAAKGCRECVAHYLEFEKVGAPPPAHVF